MKNKPQAQFTATAALFILLIAVLSIAALPYMKLLADEQTRTQFQNYIDSLGLKGLAVMFAVQVLQIIIAFIPGEPVEILAGVLYGGFGGLMLCLAGCAAASSASFVFSRKFGRPFVDKLFGAEKTSAYAFLHSQKKLDTAVFLVFLIPGTPKDMLTYIAGTTPISYGRFIGLSLFARIPSIITSTFLGSTFIAGHFGAAAAIFALTGAAGLAGIAVREKLNINRRYLRKYEQIGEKNGKTNVID